jgi:hypothetical protein
MTAWRGRQSGLHNVKHVTLIIIASAHGGVCRGLPKRQTYCKPPISLYTGSRTETQEPV